MSKRSLPSDIQPSNPSGASIEVNKRIKTMLSALPPPIHFFLNDIFYVPHDDHSLYFVGRTESGEGICAITKAKHSFFLESRTPFRNETEAQNFLSCLQEFISGGTETKPLTEVNIHKNPFWYYDEEIRDSNNLGDGGEPPEPPQPTKSKLGCPSKIDGFGTERQIERQKLSWKSTIPGALKFPKGGSYNLPADPKANENLADFLVSFKLHRKKYKTASHYTPAGTFQQTVEITTRLPYMCESLHQLFESEEYLDLVRKSRSNHPSIPARWHGGMFDYVRTYEATEEIGPRIAFRHGILRSTWCTLNNYTLFRENQTKKFYRKINLNFNLSKGELTCDKEKVKVFPMRVMAFDAEMPSPFDEETGRLIRYCKPWVTDEYCGELDLREEAEYKTDPVSVIVALILVMGQSKELDFQRGKAFVLKHPRASSPSVSPQRWEMECKLAYCKAAKSAVWKEIRTLKTKEAPKDEIEVLDKQYTEYCAMEKICRECIKTDKPLPPPPTEKEKEEWKEGDPPMLDFSKLKTPWGYDKLEVAECKTEFEIFYKLQSFLHEEDVDMILGWNESNFDFPYIAKRFQYLKALSGKDDLPELNFGSFVGGISTLKPVDGLYNKKGGSSEKLSTPGYMENDGVVIYKKDNEQKPYSLNVSSSRVVVYPPSVVSRGFELQKARYEESGCVIEDAPGGGELEYIEDMTEHRVESETYKSLTRIEDQYTKEGKTFMMKKVEFNHALGIASWEQGGYAMLRYVLYCMIDSFLAWATLRAKGKLLKGQLFAHVAEIDVGNVYARGGLYSVSNKIKNAIHEMHGGIYLVPDVGNRFFHHGGVFNHPSGPEEGVRIQWDRLRNFEEHGHFLLHPGSDLNMGSSTIPSVNQRGRRMFNKAMKGMKAGMLAAKSKKKKEAKANEGGECQPPEIGGVVSEFVCTLDFRSMYPYILFILNLCRLSALNRATIRQYGVKNYEYFTKTIGSACKNMCGDRVTDSVESGLVGCYTSDVKQTAFHQNCPTVIPAVILKLAQERTDGKFAKAVYGKVAGLAAKLSLTDWKALFNPETPEKLTDFLLEAWKRDPSHAPVKKESLSAFGKRLLETLETEAKEYPHPKGFSDNCKITSLNWNEYQDSVKRFMNSIYGVLYMMIGPLSYPELSAVITSFGRQLLSLIRSIAERMTSDHAKVHQLCFNYSKKSLSKDAMEILVTLYQRELEKETKPGEKKPTWTSPKAKELAENLLNLETSLNEGKGWNEETEQKVEAIRRSISVQNFLDFVSTKDLVGAGFLRHVDNELIAKLSCNKLLKSFSTICSVYGDSVTGDTGVVLKMSGLGSQVETRRIDEVVSDPNSWKPYLERPGKEVFEPEDMYIWQDAGFTKVKKVIRHACGKPLIRVLTHHGVVDCTEDHSLLTPRGEKISYDELEKGDDLLHCTHSPLGIFNDNLTLEEAFSWGAFFGGGQLEGSGIESISEGMKAQCYNKAGEKKVPARILNSSLENMRAFLDGMYPAGLRITDSGNFESTSKNPLLILKQKGKEACTGVWLILQRLGYQPSIDLYNNHRRDDNGNLTSLNKFEIFAFQHEKDPPCDEVVKMYTLPRKYGTTVYDFETENHHFHVGPGNLVVHNTDSIMTMLTQWSVVNKHQAFIVMNYETSVINPKLIKEMLLQPEKITETMYSHRRKKYDMMANVSENGLDPNGKDQWMFKGSDKSDELPFVTNLLEFARKYLHLRLSEGYSRSEVSKALCLHVKKKLLAFLSGEVPPAELSVTKKLSTYKPGANTIHNRVAEQMMNRGENVGSGDLITYIRVLYKGESMVTDSKTVMKTNKFGIDVPKVVKTKRKAVESLSYVLENNIPIDYESIWNDCVKTPISSYLLYVVAPITDFIPCNSAFPQKMAEQKKNRALQEEQQRKLVEKSMFQMPGDIEWKLRKRNRVKLANRDAKSYAINGALAKTKDKMDQEPLFWGDHHFSARQTEECCICGSFFTRESEFITRRVLGLKSYTVLTRKKDLSYSSKAQVCSACASKKGDKILEYKQKYTEHKKSFFEERAVCTVCISATESPELGGLDPRAQKVGDIESLFERPPVPPSKTDKPFCRTKEVKTEVKIHEKYDVLNALYKKSKPEDCTFVGCEVHVKKSAHLNYMRLFKEKIQSLDSK